MDLKTPFYDCHVKYGARIVSFAGHSLPVQYEGVIKEHMAVRQAAGLFDVSHMTEIFIKGRDALKNINMIFTNDFTKMDTGRVRYTVMCNENGGIVDDMVIYKEGDEEYVVVGNGANRSKDVSWIKSRAFGDVEIEDRSDSYAQLALQGPKSGEILSKLVGENDIPEKYYSFLHGKILGKDCIISQTGYTGEKGYEIYIKPKDAEEVWEGLLEAGQEHGLIPCGLGARDTLRLEASMPLYGHETTDNINPIEAGLGFVVKMQKDDFIGKKALEALETPKRKRVGIKITGKGIAREESKIFS
ncbi:MAG: glycine cleavage system aminomethyltransferase GcvT, partial [Clostridiales bacterium]|nr:glycine cleavage system aminomethyltransferase GcvT [Clostridiales bacterium]